MNTEDTRSLYSALVTKQSNHDQMLWQTPVIALTAQAFLLTIVFDWSRAEIHRTLCGLVSVFIGLLTWQLFLRHSALEKHASVELEAFEKKYFEQVIHVAPVVTGCIARWRSRRIWAWGLFFLSLVGLFPFLEHWIGVH